MIEAILFWVFSGISILFALGVILNVRNTIYSALCLVGAMISIAVLFVMLNAEFLGVLQIMVYAGAIVVLFVFVIMLLNLRRGRFGAESQPFLKLVGVGLILAATVKLTGLLSGPRRGWPDLQDTFGTVGDVGLSLYTDYVLAVELAGALLLAGIVSAVILAKRSVD